MAVAVAKDKQLASEISHIRALKQELDTNLATGVERLLPGNVAFLRDGRVICLERQQGDSRFPYGHNGFTFWVCASGYMHANKGRFFLFLPTGPGKEPEISFFAGQKRPDGSFMPFSLLPVPYIQKSERLLNERYAVIGHDATYFFAETSEFSSCIRVCLNQNDSEKPIIAFTILLENRTASTGEFFLSAYLNPFCRHRFFETSEDCWFKKVHVASEADNRGDSNAATQTDNSVALPPFVVTTNEDVSRTESVTYRMLIRRSIAASKQLVADAMLQNQVCTSHRAYTGGPRRGIGQASFLESGVFSEEVPVTVFNDNAVAGDLNRFKLAPGAAIRMDYLVTLAPTESSLDKQISNTISRKMVDEACQQARLSLDNTNHQLHMSVRGSSLEGIHDNTFNHFLKFLRTQVRVCAETRGFMQPSPMALIGIRDVFQAIEGHLYDQPEAAKNRIREALSYELLDGRCPRQYMVPENGESALADLREFIDQGAWVISAIYTYCVTTGDYAFLNENVGYCTIDSRDYNILNRAQEVDSVLDHLQRIMNYLDRNRDSVTGLVYALYGDWNDALDGLGNTTDPDKEFGTGVSIMASLQLFQNCTEMIELLTRLYPNQYKKEIATYTALKTKLRDSLLRHAVVSQNGQKRVVHGWGDRASYYVGSFRDSDGLSRDGLTSNAFWILSGMLPHDLSLRSHILDAMKRLDSPYGMKTFEPGFQPDAPGVGRIPKLPIGTAENGATYVHATTFAIMALFHMNEPRIAWEQIYKILPFSPHQQGISHSPFVLPNSYVHNPELRLTGQNMNDWQTGCSNVLLKTLIWYVFGFRPEFDYLRISPATWFPINGFDFRAMAQDRKVKIVLSQGDVDERQFLFNGEAIPAAKDEYSDIPYVRIPYVQLADDRENVITVIDPKQ